MCAITGTPASTIARTCGAAGVPVMAHIGFTPQSEHGLGGYRVQGRGEAADRLVTAGKAMQEAGAFAVVLEMVPAEVAAAVTATLTIPTVGIGAGPDCDAQVLVWQDMARLNQGPKPKFVKRYADLRAVLTGAATAYADEVRAGSYPGAEHSYHLSLIHISEPTRLGMISYAVFCLKK